MQWAKLIDSWCVCVMKVQHQKVYTAETLYKPGKKWNKKQTAVTIAKPTNMSSKRTL